MPIRTLNDPDDWPIRYIAISSDVTRQDLRSWLESQRDGLDLTVDAEPGALSSVEIESVVEDHVARLQVRPLEGDV